MMTLQMLLIELGISISASAIWEFIRGVLSSKDQAPSLTLLKTKLGTYLQMVGAGDADDKAERIIDLLEENDEIKILNSGAVILDGEHKAKGNGVVTAIDIGKPTVFKPGTKSIAEGNGIITAVKIGKE